VTDPDVSFACGSMVRFYLFHKNFALRAKFLWKKLESSTLPEANRAVCPGRHLVWNRPRNSRNSQELRGPDAERNFISGRVEPDILFHKNAYTLCQHYL
jgi:hypothetical protein